MKVFLVPRFGSPAVAGLTTMTLAGSVSVEIAWLMGLIISSILPRVANMMGKSGYFALIP